MIHPFDQFCAMILWVETVAQQLSITRHFQPLQMAHLELLIAILVATCPGSIPFLLPHHLVRGTLILKCRSPPLTMGWALSSFLAISYCCSMVSVQITWRCDATRSRISWGPRHATLTTTTATAPLTHLTTHFGVRLSVRPVPSSPPMATSATKSTIQITISGAPTSAKPTPQQAAVAWYWRPSPNLPRSHYLLLRHRWLDFAIVDVESAKSPKTPSTSATCTPRCSTSSASTTPASPSPSAASTPASPASKKRTSSGESFHNDYDCCSSHLITANVIRMLRDLKGLGPTGVGEMHRHQRIEHRPARKRCKLITAPRAMRTAAEPSRAEGVGTTSATRDTSPDQW